MSFVSPQYNSPLCDLGGECGTPRPHPERPPRAVPKPVGRPRISGSRCSCCLAGGLVVATVQSAPAQAGAVCAKQGFREGGGCMAGSGQNKRRVLCADIARTCDDSPVLRRDRSSGCCEEEQGRRHGGESVPQTVPKRRFLTCLFVPSLTSGRNQAWYVWKNLWYGCYLFRTAIRTDPWLQE